MPDRGAGVPGFMFRGAFTPSARAAPPLRAPTHGEPALQCLLPIARLGFVSFYNSHPDGSDVDSHCLRPGTAHFLEENTGSGWRGNFTTWVLAAIFWVRHQKHRQEQTRGAWSNWGALGSSGDGPRGERGATKWEDTCRLRISDGVHLQSV